MSPSRPPLALDRRSFLGRTAAFLAGTALLGRARPAAASIQDINPYLGEIMLIAWNFPPKGWAFCNGQLLPINQNQALFSILGTTYGGNGTTTFALPNLQGRIPLHSGTGPGLSPRTRGEVAGELSHTLIAAEMPTHSHAIQASSAVANAVSPAGMSPARIAGGIPEYAAGAADIVMAPTAIGATGGSQPHENEQPYLVINYVIALVGVFPN